MAVSAKLFAEIAKVHLYLSDDGGRAVFNSVFIQGRTKATKFQYAGTILNRIGKVAKVSGYALFVVYAGFLMRGSVSLSVGAAIGSLFPVPMIGSVIGKIAKRCFLSEHICFNK